MTTDIKPKSTGSGRVFQRPWLERWTRTHVAIPITTFLVYALALLYWSLQHTRLPAATTWILMLAGLLLFTWIEYNVHRYIFHISTSTPSRKKLQYAIHGIHHEYPKDEQRLAMPPVLSIVLGTALLFIFKGLTGDYAYSILAGVLIGYAGYLSVHYMVHLFAPPRSFLRGIWRNHALHHYKDGKVAFGVSSPLWDYIYGTYK